MKFWQEVPGTEEHCVSCYHTAAGGSGLVLLTATTESYAWDGESVKQPPAPRYAVRLVERLPATVPRAMVNQRMREIRKDPTLRKWATRIWNGKKTPTETLPAGLVAAPAWLKLDSREWSSASERVHLVEGGANVTRVSGALEVSRATVGTCLLRVFAEERVQVAPALDCAPALLDELRSFDPHQPPERWHTGPTDVLALALATSIWWLDEEAPRHAVTITKLQGL